MAMTELAVRPEGVDEDGLDFESALAEIEDKLEAEEVDQAAVDSVRAYIIEAGKEPLLNAEQEVDLAKTIEIGLMAGEVWYAGQFQGVPLTKQDEKDLELLVKHGIAAKSRLIRANLRLVVSIAKARTRGGLPIQDRIQAGNIGLIRAVEKFDYTKGYKFSTYSVWWIRQFIAREIMMSARNIRLPINLLEEINTVKSQTRDLRNDLGREPTIEEVAEAVEMTPQRVADLLLLDKDTLSLDMPVGEDDSDSVLADFVHQETSEFEDTSVNVLTTHQYLSQIDQRMAFVLRRMFGIDEPEMGVLALATVLGVHHQFISQLKADGMEAMRMLALGEELPRHLAAKPAGHYEIVDTELGPGLRRREYTDLRQELEPAALELLDRLGGPESAASRRLLEIALETLQDDTAELVRSYFGMEGRRPGSQGAAAKRLGLGKGGTTRRVLESMSRLSDNLVNLYYQRWANIDLGFSLGRSFSPVAFLLAAGLEVDLNQTPQERRDLVAKLLIHALPADRIVLEAVYGLNGRPAMRPAELARELGKTQTSISRNQRIGLNAINRAHPELRWVAR